jgi:sensory rhodopsin
MLNLVFLAGLLIFAISSVYFYFAGRNKDGLDSAFLVSFITLVSYVLMWQGNLTVVTQAGQPIFWTRWLFYALSCTLLMIEIAQLKRIQGGERAQLVYLTAIVMFTGFLAARDLTAVRWVHFVISSVAYVLLVTKVLSVKTPGAKWVRSYIFFGWTVFPIVFALAPTGLGLIGASVANLLYLLLDIYTKIVFNIQLDRASWFIQRHPAPG